MLNEDDFRRLVSGRIARPEAFADGKSVRVEIGLKDIGFHRMDLAIRDAACEVADHGVNPEDRVFTDEEEGITTPAEPAEGEAT